MSIVTKLKHAPKWSFWAAGGITGGAVLIHIYKNRATAGADPTPSPADTAYDTGAGGVAYGAGGATGVIVPPVILPADNTGSDPAGMFGMVVDAFGGIVGVVDSIYASVYNPVMGQNAQLIDGILGMQASAGGAPVNAAQNPTPMQATIPVAAPAPVAIGQSSQPTTSVTCASKYPSYPIHNPANGAPAPDSCYKDVCESHKKVHRYKDGHGVEVGKC